MGHFLQGRVGCRKGIPGAGTVCQGRRKDAEVGRDKSSEVLTSMHMHEERKMQRGLKQIEK